MNVSPNGARGTKRFAPRWQRTVLCDLGEGNIAEGTSLGKHDREAVPRGVAAYVACDGPRSPDEEESRADS